MQRHKFMVHILRVDFVNSVPGDTGGTTAMNPLTAPRQKSELVHKAVSEKLYFIVFKYLLSEAKTGTKVITVT